MSEEVSKFNIPGESRQKYGKDMFDDDIADQFARAVDTGNMPDDVPRPSGAEAVDEDVFTSARDSAAKYGK